LRTSCEVSITTANAAADDLIHAIVAHIKRDGRFSLPRFGRFTVAQSKARVAVNPRTREKIKVKARTDSSLQGISGVESDDWRIAHTGRRPPREGQRRPSEQS
jgi:DNA-binding protein HU-beta